MYHDIYFNSHYFMSNDVNYLNYIHSLFTKNSPLLKNMEGLLFKQFPEYFTFT